MNLDELSPWDEKKKKGTIISTIIFLVLLILWLVFDFTVPGLLPFTFALVMAGLGLRSLNQYKILRKPMDLLYGCSYFFLCISAFINSFTAIQQYSNF